MNYNPDLADIQEALRLLNVWIEKEQYQGWDPHDALNSPLLKRLTFGSRRMGQVWVQLVKRSPVNFRPLLGICKGYNPKGMGLFLSAHARAYAKTGQTEDLDRALFFAGWLRDNASQGYSGPCWGYNFDWPNRAFNAPAGVPTVVNTGFIGLAFLDLFDALKASKEPGLCDQAEEYLAIARGACNFVLKDLNRLQEAEDRLCFSYTPLDRRYVHNASLLGACLLAEVARRTGENCLVPPALAAARFTAQSQQDGAWPYGVSARDAFVDNFHTGFVLVALRRIGEALDVDEFRPYLNDGYNFWKENFFSEEGAPKYYLGKTYPIDVHAVAQSILTYLAFSTDDPMAVKSAVKLARWGIQHFQDKQGYFYYQRYPRYTNKIPYMRWAQAWMKLALTEMVLSLS